MSRSKEFSILGASRTEVAINCKRKKGNATQVVLMKMFDPVKAREDVAFRSVIGAKNNAYVICVPFTIPIRHDKYTKTKYDVLEMRIVWAVTYKVSAFPQHIGSFPPPLPPFPFFFFLSSKVAETCL